MDIFGLIISLFCLILGFEIGREMGYHDAMDELKELWSKIQDVVYKAAGVELEIKEVVTTGDENDR